MRLRTIARALVAALLACAPLTPALGQANISGQIEGKIVDGRGRPLAGVTVTLEGPALFAPRAAITGAGGEFRFPALPVGRYMLRADLVGYQSFVTTDIVLNAGEIREFPMNLYEGLVERVTVVAEHNLIDTRSTQSREVLDSDYVNALPLSARRYQQVFSVFPGITNHSDSGTAQFHLHGGTTYQIGYRVDGASINGPDTGRFRLNINQNAIERFEVISGGAPAEYGEQSSGILNAITRSGGNDFKFFYSGMLRNGSFAARQQEIDDLEDGLAGARTFNNPLRQKQQWQEFYVSGPVIRDRLWFFFAGQYWQEDLGGLVRTDNGGAAVVDQFRRGDRFNFQLKLDWQVSPDNQMAFNVFTDPAEFKDIELLPTVSRETNRNQKQGGYLIQARDTHIFTPSTFLETQYFLHHEYLAQRPANPGAGTFTQDYATGIFSGAFYSDIDNTFDRHRVTTALTHAHGAHTIKGGFDYSFIDYRANYRKENWVIDLGSGPYYSYYYVIDFLNEDKLERQESEVAAFLQDRLSLFGDRVTVDVGARYQRQSVIGDSNVAPRMGVSVDPRGDGRTRIFANYGHFYDSVFFQVMDRFDTNDGIATNLSFDAPDCSYYCIPGTPQYYAIPEDLEQPKKVQWQVGIERELPGDFRVGVTHTRWDTDNDILSTFDATTGSNFLFTDGRSDYHGTEITIRKPFGRRIEFFGSYTRSRTRSQQNNSEELSLLRSDDPLATAFTRAAYDRPDVLNLSGRFRLPGNIDLTAVYRYQDGILISPHDGASVIDPAFGKNSYRLPPFRTLDLLLARSFTFGRADVRFMLHVFNLTNEFNVIGVGERTDAAGTINELGTPQIVDIPRTVQAGVELRF